jgi:hypothetical protein
VLTVRTNPPFRVLYDLRWMELGRAGGVEQATFDLVAAVSRLDRKNAYRILAPRSACWEWEFPPAFAVSRLPSDTGEPAGERLHRYVAECTARGAAAGAGNGDVAFDLVHSTASYIHPELIEFPGVLTIHDLQHLHHPEFFDPPDWRSREALYRASAERARHIICSSEFTRRDVHERYGVPLERMTTVWPIPGDAWWREVPIARRRSLLAAMDMGGPFLFYPAQCWPHKNHERLVRAFAFRRSTRHFARYPSSASPRGSFTSATALRSRSGRSCRSARAWCFRRSSRDSACRSRRRSSAENRSRART